MYIENYIEKAKKGKLAYLNKEFKYDNSTKRSNKETMLNIEKFVNNEKTEKTRKFKEI